MTIIEIIATLSNLFCAVVLALQHRRHQKYRESIHALLQDGGRVYNEPALIVDEMLRMSAYLKMREPTLQEFGHALAKQKSFRRAVTHEELHDIYIQTHGRSL